MRRSSQSSPICWSDFHKHACIWACDLTAIGILHIPTEPSSISATIQLFLLLLSTPGRSHRSIVALVSSQHNLGQICVQVHQFSVLHSCLFSYFLFELRFPSFNPPAPVLRNQIVGGASQSAPTLCSTSSLLLDHSSGDLWMTSEYASVPAGFLTQLDIHLAQQNHRQGGKRKFICTVDKHRHTATRSCSKSQRRVHYRTIQVYIKSP